MNNLRVLLVEEEGAAKADVAGRLDAARYEVYSTRGTIAALQMVLTQQWDVCLLECTSDISEVQELVSAVRQIEAGQDSATGLPILICAPPTLRTGTLSGIDGVLVPSFNEADFRVAVAAAGTNRNTPRSGPAEEKISALPVFQPEGFAEQCVSDKELMSEIIDLFSEERSKEVPEMREAVATKDLERLYKLAHTLKGSLGTLNAPRARQQALDLELAARCGDQVQSALALRSLEVELEQLAADLNAFRQLSLLS